VRERDVVFPAVKLAHFQKKNAERKVAGMTRIRDVTVFLNRVDQLAEVQHGMMF
jgi:hypothetical protein